MVFLFAWLVITTPAHVRFTITSRENPAGQAIAANVQRLQLPDFVKLLFVRRCSQNELAELGTSPWAIDIATQHSSQRLSTHRVVVATTGTIHDYIDSRPVEFGSHVSNSSILVHEEGQECIEYKSAVAMSAPAVPCMLILVGDRNRPQEE